MKPTISKFGYSLILYFSSQKFQLETSNTNLRPDSSHGFFFYNFLYNFGHFLKLPKILLFALFVFVIKNQTVLCDLLTDPLNGLPRCLLSLHWRKRRSFVFHYSTSRSCVGSSCTLIHSQLLEQFCDFYWILFLHFIHSLYFNVNIHCSKIPLKFFSKNKFLHPDSEYENNS